MTKPSDMLLYDLAASRLWIALRSTEAVDRFWPEWNVAALPVVPELVREPYPDRALISAMRSGARIKVYGVHQGRDEPEQLPPQVWPYAQLTPDEYAGNVGRIGQWRGVTVVARDLRKAFPVNGTSISAPTMRAKLELIALAKAAEAGNSPTPVGSEWKELAPELYGINDFAAFKIWKEVARDYPVLSNPKGKPKRRKAA